MVNCSEVDLYDSESSKDVIEVLTEEKNKIEERIKTDRKRRETEKQLQEHEGNFKKREAKLEAEKKEFEETKAEAIKELDKREKNIEIIVTGRVNVI